MKVITKLILKGATKHYEKELIKIYFESAEHSGGGKIESVELLGGGEAEIIFCDMKGKCSQLLLYNYKIIIIIHVSSVSLCAV